jgi:hypothetical protein
MADVKIGDVVVGNIQFVHGVEYIAYRVGVEGDIRVGTAATQTGALNLIARSLIHRSITDVGLNPTQRTNLASLTTQLRGMGLGDLANAVEDALK